MSSGAPKHENRLIHETSPYLLQHAHNPVDWYPWGPEALERAREEDKPILLSIGYAACHWCHVMERESFENHAIAELMNRHFVCIKVDREERPDLDDIYMAATIAMNGSGGWPMTVFLTPEQEPFFAGTYFPPADKYGRPGLPTLLTRIAELWRNERSQLLSQAEELTAHVREQARPSRPLAVGAEAIGRAKQQLSASFDPRWGGFGSAPKFPPAAALSLLLRDYRRSGDARALEMVTGTLNGMKNGGMYDHVAGGFARYSTDERWLVPHFEKMLYDNALLARVYLEAYQVTHNDEYRRVASETLDYVIREMQGPEGGYYSATDADSEGEEGKFYVFRPDEIREILDADLAEQFCLYFDLTEQGNWEGKSIPNTPRPREVVAKELGIPVATLTVNIERARRQVYEARKRRVPPLLDDKVLTAWNALMISAMAEGARVLGEARYLESAERAARHLGERMRRPDSGLYRTARAGKAHLDGYLEDYAYLSDALVDLYEAGGAPQFLDEAERIAARLIADFADDAGGAFYNTAHQHESLLVRAREGHDGAMPNPNAVAARALARLSLHLDRPVWRELAEAALRAYGGAIERSPRAFATALAVVDFLLDSPIELVLIGAPNDAGYRALAGAIGQVYLPNRVQAHALPEVAASSARPLLAGKGLVQGRSALYICENFACQAPLADAARAQAELERRSRPAASAEQLSGKALPGRATAQGTAAYKARFAELQFGYTELGRTALTVSRVGFGGYRVHDLDPTHREALEEALRSGVNLIDTSTNYTDGRSETLIGQVIADCVKKNQLARAEVVVVSKVGYVQGQNLELAQQREAEGRPIPDMVKYAEDVWHCIHPEWLADQITRSLARLELETLDVCLLHNPEYFLSDAKKHGGAPLAVVRDTFYRRLREAFAALEQEVARGRIGCYGVSSNTAGSSANSAEATELSRMLLCAREVAGEQHHFRVLELPLNLLEAGAVFEKNNADGARTVLAEAERERVAVLANRPLNAIFADRLVRFTDPPELGQAPPFDSQLQEVAELEKEYRTTIAQYLQTGSSDVQAEQFFAWAPQLKELPARLQSFEQWQEIETHTIAPQIRRLFRALDEAITGELSQRWRDWRGRYLNALEHLFESLRKRAADRSRARASRIHAALAPALPEAQSGAPLSQKALWILASTPGVSTVLVGMRRASYVQDCIEFLRWQPLADASRAYEAARAADLT